MICVRSGQAMLVTSTNGSAAAIARGVGAARTVAGVAITPMRPLRVAATACTAPGCTTPSTSTPRVVCISRSRSAGSAAAVARVAGDDEQLDPAGDQLLGDLQAERLELPRRALAVREPRGVREVHEVLVRQLHQQLVQHRQPTDAGVEHAHGAPAQLLWRVRGHARAVWHARACASARRVGPAAARRVAGSGGRGHRRTADRAGGRTAGARAAYDRSRTGRRCGRSPGAATADPSRRGTARTAERRRLTPPRRPRRSRAFSFFTTASAIPVSENEPLALTTPAIRTATSRTRPTYSTVPCPRSRRANSAACALPISSYSISGLPIRLTSPPRCGAGIELRAGG